MTERSPPQDEDLRLHFLVLRCQAGDEAAFGDLLQKFNRLTLRYLRGLIGEDAEDVQQDVWLSVYRGIASLSNPRAFRTWLFRTTRHRAIDFLRRVRREKEIMQEIVLQVSQTGEAADTEAPVPDDFMIEEALSDLTPVQREVLLLRYREDLSYAEIALVVGCSVGTVRSRLHYARLRMTELLRDPTKNVDACARPFTFERGS